MIPLIWPTDDLRALRARHHYPRRVGALAGARDPPGTTPWQSGRMIVALATDVCRPTGRWGSARLARQGIC